VQDHLNQTVLLDGFAGHLKPEQSFCFFYARPGAVRGRRGGRAHPDRRRARDARRRAGVGDLFIARAIAEKAGDNTDPLDVTIAGRSGDGGIDGV
jgi:hypothetical protein